MKKIKQKRINIYFIVTAVIDILMVIAVFVLMNYVKYLLNADMQINLTEIVTQNKDVITSKLMLEVNNLDLVAKQIAKQYDENGENNTDSLKTIFLAYAEDAGDKSLYLGTDKGIGVFPDGKELDISGRHYFRRAMEGRYNISERLVSRKNGKDIFVISMPVYSNNNLIGTIQKQYTQEEMYDICEISLFMEQGNMYIINSQGYILINSEQDKYYKESDNYYRILYLTNPEAAEHFQDDITNEKSGFMETEIYGEKFFSAYTPIDLIYDWYLITSVNTKAVSPNGNFVIGLFYGILLFVAAFFALSMFYFHWLKNKQEKNLIKIAFVDSITGGSTFTKFELDLKELLEKNRDNAFYLLSFDIDNFKYINSFYGFDTGDQILKKIYSLYESKLLPDERLARVTSDHFAVLLFDASKERLADIFDTELTIDKIKIYLSAGLYKITDASESVSLMLDKANMAKQKKKGIRYKQIEVYSDEYDKQMKENEHIKREMEIALSNDEIIPFFQPKVNVNTGKLEGAEALARWKTSDGKLIPPGAFISVCEQTGLIVKVDMIIFEKTLQFLQLNLEKGIKCVPISVNFSRTHLLNDDFIQSLLAKLEEYHVPPELIEVELTETIIFDNYQMINNFINKLHDIGLKISMDDFGSGYSSLHMLKDVCIDVLKIDREFLKETANSSRQKVIFAAIARMAKELHIKVVVEGVETMENIVLMKEFDCPIAQGFYFAKPMEQSDFCKIYEKGKIG